MQKKWHLAAHKSDRRTARGLEQLRAVEVVEEAAEAVAVAVAAAWAMEEEPEGQAWRAGAAAASPGTG